MILLNKFIQCLSYYWPFDINCVRLNSSYMPGCLANLIVLVRGHRGVYFNNFNEIKCGSCKIIEIYLRCISRRLIFQKNGYVRHIDVYRSESQKIVCCINHAYSSVETSKNIKDILRWLYV